MKYTQFILAIALGAAAFTYAQQGRNGANSKDKVHASIHDHRTKSAKRGHELYARHCSECHGEEGSGAGPLAYDFDRGDYAGIYKKHKPWPFGCPSTDQLTDNSIKEITTKGRYCPEHGFVMPPFQLPEKDMQLIINEIRGLKHAHAH